MTAQEQLQALYDKIDAIIAENLALKEALYLAQREEKEIRRQLASMRGA